MKTENQKEMDRVVKEMAVYFEKNIAASDLCRWVGLVNEKLFFYPEKLDYGPELTGVITWGILQNLINCKTKEERLKVLAEEIPCSFGSLLYPNVKAALNEIGTCWLKAFVKYNNDEESIAEFMKLFTSLLCLCEMYAIYELYDKKQMEVRMSAA